MNFSVREASTFKKIIDSIKDLGVENSNIRFSSDSLVLETMDITHSSIIFLKLTNNFFESYKCEQPLTIGLSILILNKIIKVAKDDDQLIVEYCKDDNTLDITIKNKIENVSFSIPELELEETELQIDDDQYNYNIKLEKELFIRTMNSLSVVEGINLFIQKKDDKIIFSTEGDLGKVKINVPMTIILNNKDDISNYYSCSFLKKFQKACSIPSEINLSMSDNFPLKLSSIFGDSFLKFYMAPKDV